ncbi:MAG: thioredoxin family protein [Ruminococcus sp.]|nr:thioredoxin family protein [Ruminococcus sp.]
MITYATDENYKELVSDGIVLVDFFSKTCVPCKMLARSLEEIDDELPFVNIVKVDIDDCPKTAEEFRINGIPDLYYYNNGEVLSHEPGAVDSDYIKEKLAAMLY